MSLFDRLWRLLTNTALGPAEPAHTTPRASHHGAVATAESAPDDAELAHVSTMNELDAGAKEWWVADLEKAAQLQTGATKTTIDRNLFDALTKTLDDSEIELPRMPRVADQALVKLREENVDYRDLAEIVQQDAALTAQVLRVANSVAYRGFSEIRNLDLAFARIGQRSLRGIILGTTVRSIAIRTGGATRSLGEDLWRASLASAVVCGELSRRMGKPEDDAFLTGLLHDIGMLGVLRVSHDFAQKRGGLRITPELYFRLAGEWHEHLGRRLADAWALPDPLPEIIGSHHRPPREDDPDAMLRHMIAFSDAVCALLGHAPYQPIDLLALPAAAALGIANTPATREWLQSLPGLISERVDAF